jgi:hypothetical protein
VKRAVLALPILLLAVAVAASCRATCKGGLSHDECTEMLDKYLDMSIVSENEGGRELSPPELAAAREVKKALRKSEASFKRVTDQCEREVSRSEYRCAMKANTPETWQACID